MASDQAAGMVGREMVVSVTDANHEPRRHYCLAGTPCGNAMREKGDGNPQFGLRRKDAV